MIWKHTAQRMKQALGQTAQALRQIFKAVATSTDLDASALSLVEEALIQVDLGPELAQRLVKDLAQNKIQGPDLASFLQQHILDLIVPYQRTLAPCPLLIAVGINGAGKTTILGKLAQRWHGLHHPICVVAADTFRAAASEQLLAWTPFAHFLTDPGRDPASLAFQGANYGQAHPGTCVLVDTAGRLPNKPDLMDQLRKIVTVTAKAWPEATPQILLVVDAGSGQHALVQAKAFCQAVPVTGLIMTKMDTTPKAGIVVPLALQTRLPIMGLGVGEGAQDLCDFDAQAFVQEVIPNDLC